MENGPLKALIDRFQFDVMLGLRYVHDEVKNLMWILIEMPVVGGDQGWQFTQNGLNQ